MDDEERTLRLVGQELLRQLMEGSIRLEHVPDQQMLIEKQLATSEQLAGVVLHMPELMRHEFHVAVLHAWQTAGASAAADASVWEAARETFISTVVDLLRGAQGGPVH